MTATKQPERSEAREQPVAAAHREYVRARQALLLIASKEIQRLTDRLRRGLPPDPSYDGDPPLSHVPSRIQHIEGEMTRIHAELKKRPPKQSIVLR